MLSKVLSENIEKSVTVQNDYCSEIGKHKADKTKYRDFDFVPKMPLKPEDKELFTGVEWERIEKVYEQCSNTEIKNTEIRRGLIKDDALIAVLSAAFTDHSKILTWFQEPIEIATGIICVNIPFQGKVVSVVVDSKVPRFEGKPVLSKPVRGGFPWSAFIEKALAKLLGSFKALEQLGVKELLFHLFNYSSKTVISANVTDRFLEEISSAIKQNSLALVTIGNSKDSEEAGLLPGSTYVLQNISKNKGIYVLLFNPGGKRKFMSTFEERIDKWKQDAKFPKVKDDCFVLRSNAIQKYTESVIVGSPTLRSPTEVKLEAKIEAGQKIATKQFKLKSEKFANINFIVECQEQVLHEITIYEVDKLKSRLSTKDPIDFFTIRTDPEKYYTIVFSAEGECTINATLGTDSEFKTEEEDYKENPLQAVGTGQLICGKTDGRSPKVPSSLSCLPQWRLHFTEPGKIIFRVINKSISENKHYFFLAQTGGEKLSVQGEFFYQEHVMEGNQDSAEWSIDLTDVSKDYVFGCYRPTSLLNSTFDFEVLAEKPLQMKRCEAYTDAKNTAYIEEKFNSTKNDLRSPVPGHPGITRLHQYVLTVDQAARVFVNLEHDDSGKHCLGIQQGEQRINHFGQAPHYFFESYCKFDSFEFDAEPGSYTFAFVREPIKGQTEVKAYFYSNAEMTIRQLPTLTTEKCHVFSRDIRFKEDDGKVGFFPMDTTDVPENQYYLVIPESTFIIGNLETNSTQDDASYCLYLEDNDGKLLKEINTSHFSEHAISFKDSKEWFTFNIKCEEGTGRILTFVVTKKSNSSNRTSVAVRFFSPNNLQVLSAQEDLTEDMKKEIIESTKESSLNLQKKNLSSAPDQSKSARDGGTTQNKDAQKGQNSNSTWCLLI